MALYPDLLFENCDDISDWTDGDAVNGVSEVSPAGQFRMDGNTHAASNKAELSRTITSPPDKFTIEIKLYHDGLGAYLGNDYFSVSYSTRTWALILYFSTDGLYINKTGGTQTEVGTNLVKSGVSAEWQTWQFRVDKSGGEASATTEVFLDGVSQGTVDCDYEKTDAPTDRLFILRQKGVTTDNMLTHVEYIKIATGLGNIDEGICFLMFF